MPLIVISILIGLIAVTLILVTGRSFWGIILPSAILSSAGPIWYLMGLNAAMDLLNERLSGAQEGLSLELGFYFSIAGSILAISAFILSLIIFIISKRRKSKDMDSGTSQGKVLGSSAPTFKRLEENEGIKETPSFKKVEDPSMDTEGPTSISVNQTNGQIMSKVDDEASGKVGSAPPRPPVDPLS